MQTGLDHLTTGSLLLGTVSLWEQIGSRGKAISSQLYPDQVQK